MWQPSADATKETHSHRLNTSQAPVECSQLTCSQQLCLPDAACWRVTLTPPAVTLLHLSHQGPPLRHSLPWHVTHMSLVNSGTGCLQVGHTAVSPSWCFSNHLSQHLLCRQCMQASRMSSCSSLVVGSCVVGGQQTSSRCGTGPASWQAGRQAGRRGRGQQVPSTTAYTKQGTQSREAVTPSWTWAPGRWSTGCPAA
jgi:hypothetical protein